MDFNFNWDFLTVRPAGRPDQSGPTTPYLQPLPGITQHKV